MALLAACGCSSVSQMQARYEAGDASQFERILTIADRRDYPYATRKSAVKALGQIADPRAVPVLSRILGEFDQRTTLKGEALVALGRIGDPAAVGAIGRLLDRSLSDTNGELRMAAMPILGSLGGAEAAVILVNALTYYDLAMLRSERAVPRGVFTGDEQSIRDLRDSLRTPDGVSMGQLDTFGGQQGFPTSGMFGTEGSFAPQGPEDSTPKERALAHASLVEIGADAVPAIGEHLARRETTVTLRTELTQILEQIRGATGQPPAAASPGSG